jgi:hypothetical protein
MVSSGGTAAIPFSLEPEVSVASEHQRNDGGSHATSIAFGDLVVAHATVQETHYRLRSDLDQPATIVIKHPLTPKSQLLSPPAGTDTASVSGVALVPCAVPAHADAEVVLQEHLVEQQAGDWMSTLAESTVKAYLANPKADPDVVKKLTAAWALRTSYVDDTRRCNALRDQAYAAEESTLRMNDAEHRSRSYDLKHKAVECEEKAAETKSKFDDAIRQVSIGSL